MSAGSSAAGATPGDPCAVDQHGMTVEEARGRSKTRAGEGGESHQIVSVTLRSSEGLSGSWPRAARHRLGQPVEGGAASARGRAGDGPQSEGRDPRPGRARLRRERPAAGGPEPVDRLAHGGDERRPPGAEGQHREALVGAAAAGRASPRRR